MPRKRRPSRTARQDSSDGIGRRGSPCPRRQSASMQDSKRLARLGMQVGSALDRAPARPESSPVPRPGLARRVKSTGQRARCLANMGGDRIHKGRRVAVIGLQFQLPQPRTDAIHRIRRSAGFDDRGDESGELGCRPAELAGEFGVNEVEAMEGMLGVLDPAIHVNTAIPAGMASNGGGPLPTIVNITASGPRRGGAGGPR